MIDSLFQPINFKKWIEENRASLKPPVGNKLIWENREFIAFVVGGPNTRTDYHSNGGEEFFYQLEGDIELRILKDGKRDLISIKEGDIYLLPARIPHSPRRPAGTLGLVIERKRNPGEWDGFIWICEYCDSHLHEERVALVDLVKDLPPIFDRFYSSLALTTCKQCGKVAAKS